MRGGARGATFGGLPSSRSPRMSFLRCRSSPHARFFALLAFGLIGLACTGSALADAADAHIAPPQDTPYPGTLQIHVDASDTRQGIFRVHETIPVQAKDALARVAGVHVDLQRAGIRR